MKAIRTTYNTFLLSKSNNVQIVAQGTVTHMIQNVFSRIPKPYGQNISPTSTISQSSLDTVDNNTSTPPKTKEGIQDDIRDSKDGKETDDSSNRYFYIT